MPACLFSKSFFVGIEFELGRTPFVEAVEVAPAVIFDGHPEMERIGDVVSWIGRKLGKAVAIGALAIGATNTANAPGGYDGNGHLGHGGNEARVC
jgi:hypothetical protein